MNTEVERPIEKITFDPGDSDTKPGREAFKKNSVIDANGTHFQLVGVKALNSKTWL